MEMTKITGKTNQGSADERSLIQPKNGALRNSIALLNTIKTAQKKGICNINGKQPIKGLPSRIRATCSFWSSAMRGSFLSSFFMRSCKSFILGCKAAAFFIETELFHRKGKKNILRTTVNKMMAQP